MVRSSDNSYLHRYVCNLKFILWTSVWVFFMIIAIVYFSTTNFQDGHEILPTPSKWANNEEIRIFREYLRIQTVHSNINYKPIVAFLEKQAVSLNLPMSVYYPANDENPVVVMTWKGSQPELPTIMLNSHMDVVPVYEEYWTHPPFAAEMEENGDIFARGAQDMKCLGMQYLAAIRSLKKQGINQLKRTIHIVYVPDEEKGGQFGMAQFSKSNIFKAMNVAFVLDEGAPDINGTFPAYFVERTIWQIEFTFNGQSGHGSKFLENTPGEKLSYVVGKMTEFRQQEKRKLTELKYPYGNVTTINLTIVKGGVQNNVIPAEMSAVFDMRVSINTDIDEFERQIHRWCEEAGGDIIVKTLQRGQQEKATIVDDSNIFWAKFKRGVSEAGYAVEPAILGPSSDMKYIRRMNISAIGFSPLINTTAKFHDHNEYINADSYLAGIAVYKKIILNVGDT